MDRTSILSIEICRECNLAGEHSKCPIREDRHPNKDREIGDETILRVVSDAYALGFRGFVAWHYYNEPMMAIGRVTNLIKRIRVRHPKARFLLWTNGTLLTRENAPVLLQFDKVYITNYSGRDFEFTKDFCPDVTIEFRGFDERRDDERIVADGKCCLKPYNELVVDNFGEVRLCCSDWRGHVRIGNVHVFPFPVLAEKFKRIRDAVSHEPMLPEAPPFCRTCPEKHQTKLGWIE